MVRIKLKAQIAEKEFKERRRITLQEIARETGIARATLTKALYAHGAGLRADTMERLCTYFACPLDDLVEFVSSDTREG